MPKKNIRKHRSRTQSFRRGSKQSGKPGSSSFILRFRTLLKIFITIFIILFVGLSLCFGYLYMTRTWDGDERISIALQNPSIDDALGEVLLVSYNPGEPELSVVVFPENMTVEAIGDYGQWRLRSLYSLGKLENKGGYFLRRSLEYYFGVEIEGYLAPSVPVYAGVEQFTTQLADAFLISIYTRETNLNLYEQILLWYRIRQLSSQRVRIIDINKQQILKEHNVPDGSVLLTPDMDMLDAFSKQVYVEPKIVDEQLVISVYNATHHSGLGYQASRRITNMGGTLIALGDVKDQMEVTHITVGSDELLQSFTVGKIRSFFSKAIVEVGDTTGQRSDIVIYLGEDYFMQMQELGEEAE